MKKSLLPFLILGIFLGLAGCTNGSSDGTDPADISSAETGSEISDSSQPGSSASISQSSAAAISNSSPVPTATPSTFTFDLTEEQVTVTPRPLMFIGGMDEAVIIGGDSSPYRYNATFYSGISETDLDTAIIDSDNCEYSIDRAELAFMDGNSSVSHTLLYYNGAKAYEVATDVERYVLSLTGNAMAYIVQNGDLHDLYIYDTVTKETRLVSGDIGEKISCLCISPSGDAVGYMDMGSTLHLTVGENKRKIEIPGYAFAISDGGKLVYYEEVNKNTSSFFVYTEGRHISLGSETAGEKISSQSGIIFNRDLTQVLVAVNNELWFSKDGSRAICITFLDDEAFTGDSDTSWGFSCISTETQIRNCSCMFLPAKNLCNQLYRFANTILFCDANMEVRYLSTHTSEPEQDSSAYGEQLAYLKHSLEYDGYDVYYTTDYREPESEVKIPVEYAEKVVITKDQSLYIENDIGQIFLVKGDCAPFLIDTYSNLIGQYEVDRSTYIYYTKKSFMGKPNYFLFDLYRIEDIKGATSQKISSEIYEVYIDSTGIYTFEDSSIDVFSEAWYEVIWQSTNGRNFTFLCTKEYGP